MLLLRYDNALIRASPAFLTALPTGGQTSTEDHYMRMVARFDTGVARYSWLPRSLVLGEGRIAGDHRIEYSIYRLD